MPKDNEVDEKVPVYVVTAPERIYLQVADDAYYAEDPFPAEEEVTWCADSVMELEVSYVREDLHAATVAELRAEVAENEAVINVWRRRCEAAERRVGELTSLLSDTVGNLHRMGNNEFADCDQERLDIVISRIERTITGADPT